MKKTTEAKTSIMLTPNAKKCECGAGLLYRSWGKSKNAYLMLNEDGLYFGYCKNGHSFVQGQDGETVITNN